MTVKYTTITLPTSIINLHINNEDSFQAGLGAYTKKATLKEDMWVDDISGYMYDQDAIDYELEHPEEYGELLDIENLVKTYPKGTLFFYNDFYQEWAPSNNEDYEFGNEYFVFAKDDLFENIENYEAVTLEER